MAMAIALLSNLGGYHHLLQACRLVTPRKRPYKGKGIYFAASSVEFWGLQIFDATPDWCGAPQIRSLESLIDIYFSDILTFLYR